MILSAFDFCDFSLCPLQMSITVDGFDSAKIGVMSRAGQHFANDLFYSCEGRRSYPGMTCGLRG